MSLGIALKGAEGIVLAADSRVTLTATNNDPTTKEVFHVFYDNATKLLKVNGQEHIGAVTYGAGSIGKGSPRTAHSYLPEFEAELTSAGVGRLTVEDFASRLSDFFARQWQAAQMPLEGPMLMFLVGGYDLDEPYGRIYEIAVPTSPKPIERNSGPGTFGITLGGQTDIAQRLMTGYDQKLLGTLQEILGLTDEERNKLALQLGNRLKADIPFPFLPLQDCVDLSILLIRTTIAVQNWIVGLRGVGGPIDVATVTRTEGFSPIQNKTITGERLRD